MVAFVAQHPKLGENSVGAFVSHTIPTDVGKTNNQPTVRVQPMSFKLASCLHIIELHPHVVPIFSSFCFRGKDRIFFFLFALFYASERTICSHGIRKRQKTPIGELPQLYFMKCGVQDRVVYFVSRKICSALGTRGCGNGTGPEMGAFVLRCDNGC